MPPSVTPPQRRRRFLLEARDLEPSWSRTLIALLLGLDLFDDAADEKDVVDAVGEDFVKVGEKLMVGQGMPAEIIEVTDSEVALDANHPLAGKNLTFDVEIIAVESV